MKLSTRIAVLLFCFSLCVGGAMLSVKESARDNRPKTEIVPINNRQPQRAVWIWA
jgi:hypothetical protein